MLIQFSVGGPPKRALKIMEKKILPVGWNLLGGQAYNFALWTLNIYLFELPHEMCQNQPLNIRGYNNY